MFKVLLGALNQYQDDPILTDLRNAIDNSDGFNLDTDDFNYLATAINIFIVNRCVDKYDIEFGSRVTNTITSVDGFISSYTTVTEGCWNGGKRSEYTIVVDFSGNPATSNEFLVTYRLVEKIENPIVRYN